MTILYVDIEHDRLAEDAGRGPAHRAKREATRRRLEELAGEPCRLVRWHAVTPAWLDEVRPTAIVLSGCGTDWAEYDFGAWEGLLAVIRRAPAPLLGICGGHQLIGYAHGAPWGPLGALDEGEADDAPGMAPGWRKELGFLAVQVDAGCPLFRGLGGTPAFYESHYWQVLAPPAGFVARAATALTPIQAIERGDRPVFGVQFHPEHYDESHPDGETVLRNFFALARSWSSA